MVTAGGMEESNGEAMAMIGVHNCLLVYLVVIKPSSYICNVNGNQTKGVLSTNQTNANATFLCSRKMVTMIFIGTPYTSLPSWLSMPPTASCSQEYNSNYFTFFWGCFTNYSISLSAKWGGGSQRAVKGDMKMDSMVSTVKTLKPAITGHGCMAAVSMVEPQHTMLAGETIHQCKPWNKFSCHMLAFLSACRYFRPTYTSRSSTPYITIHSCA